MKIAHFAVFAPPKYISGQYMTVKDLILAERSVGIDAQFIDYGHQSKAKSREGLTDGAMVSAPLEWARSADIIVRHSAVPKWAFDKNRVMVALHGRPENSFRIELKDEYPVISDIMLNKDKYCAFLTFWSEYLFYWSRILIGKKVVSIPSPVDLETFTIEGDRRDWGSKSGDPNIVIADMWRDDRIPFNLIFAAQYFKEHYCKDAKLHIYGLPTKTKALKFLESFNKLGLLGELYGLTKDLPEIYRAADMVITPNIIATRIIRESLSSGTPIVAPCGCNYTPHTADPRDTEVFAKAMYDCYCAKHDPMVLRQQMIDRFNPNIVGNSMKQLCEMVL